MAKHKWHDEIVAWASGEIIEAKNIFAMDNWDADPNPYWDCNDFKFRIKPQPKEPQYVYVWLDKEMGEVVFDYEPPHIVKEDEVHKYIGKIKLEDESE
jgi:hypothetical protein